jgi:hypothetical protein
VMRNICPILRRKLSVSFYTFFRKFNSYCG